MSLPLPLVTLDWTAMASGTAPNAPVMLACACGYVASVPTMGGHLRVYHWLQRAAAERLTAAALRQYHATLREGGTDGN